MNDSQLRWLSRNFGEEYARINKGVATLITTGEQIAIECMAYQKVKADGVYRLSKATCGDAIPDGHGGNMDATAENIKKYQCQVGRRAPKCNAYSKHKCAVFFFEEIDSLPLNIKPSELIALCNVK